MLLRFTSCCACRICNGKEESSHRRSHPSPSCVLGGGWSPRRRCGPLSHGDTAELGERHGAAHFQWLEGNFRKVKTKLLDFIVTKYFLATLLRFPRWTLSALLLCRQIARFSTHHGGIQEDSKCLCWRACLQPTFPLDGVQRPAGA